MPLRTPLYELHKSRGARLVDYAGWEMPLLYRGIVEEHLQTRASGSLFDVSHMGRLKIAGKGAEGLLERVLTRRVGDMKPGRCRYSLVCDETGGVMDDIVVARDVADWLVICNAANRAKIFGHFRRIAEAEGFDATVTDRTESTAMVAVQGPKVIQYLSDRTGLELADLKRWSFVWEPHLLGNLMIFRSGYTGEDGVEMIVSADTAAQMMKPLLGEISAPDAVIRPAGLGARDTLRLEAALPLYGHELDADVDPISAGLAWAVSLDKPFIGAERLREIAARGPARTLAGLTLDGRRIARQGQAVLAGGKTIGKITSGTLAPSLQCSIAMAYLDADSPDADSAAADPLSVDFNGSQIRAQVVPLPFYRKPST